MKTLRVVLLTGSVLATTAVWAAPCAVTVKATNDPGMHATITTSGAHPTITAQVPPEGNNNPVATAQAVPREGNNNPVATAQAVPAEGNRNVTVASSGKPEGNNNPLATARAVLSEQDRNAVVASINRPEGAGGSAAVVASVDCK